MLIREFLPNDVSAVKKFTDRVVGDGYYSIAELTEFQKKSIAHPSGDICSFVLVDASTCLCQKRS